jgi:hypothetical protein
MDITSANAVYTLSVATIFPSPVVLQQFAAEDIFTTDPVAIAEVVMGVDGFQSGGYTPRSIPQQISLQADSASMDVFDQWANNTRLNRRIYLAQGVIVLQSISKTWTLINGILNSFPPIPNAAKILQPRRFTITWENVIPAPV